MELGQFVVVRTQFAGVHVGTLSKVRNEYQQVELSNASRIWRWRGANTLHEMAIYGPGLEWTRISERVPLIMVQGVIEIIPAGASPAALWAPRWPE